MTNLHKEKIKQLSPYFLISLGLLLVFVGLGTLKPIRVGDGAEYYALFYAWDTTYEPWMTPTAYEAYERLYASHEIKGMVTSERLETVFSRLKNDATQDFNHFWFYSFLAFICSNLFLLFGITLSIHQSFLALHYMLLAVTAIVAYRFFNWQGLAAVLLMTFVSPMLWYLDKVHTELFTYCLVLLSIMLICARRYLLAALFLGFAATQNPSFAPIACIPIIYRMVIQRDKPYSIVDVVLIVATVMAILAHPVYYYLRHGVITPQLMVGGASLGGNLSLFYVWIIDPDLGLLPNWPLGLAAILLALGIYLSRRHSSVSNIDWRSWWIFVAAYTLVSLYANSSTQNLNSGATPGLARYALWYIPLLFPIIHKILVSFPWKSKGTYFLVPIFLALAAQSLYANHSRRPAGYLSPSGVSFFIQSYLPWLYNPPKEVFLERYTDYGERARWRSIRGVVGPDCRKTLLLPGEKRRGISAPAHCLFNRVKLDSYISTMASNLDSPKYIRLDNKEVQKMLLELTPRVYKLGVGASGNFILGKGWGMQTKWGVWTGNEQVRLQIPCSAEQFIAAMDNYSLSFVVYPVAKQHLTVTGDNRVLWEGNISRPSTSIRLTVPSQNCDNRLSTLVLTMSAPTSPPAHGQPAASGKLGMRLQSFQITGAQKVP